MTSPSYFLAKTNANQKVTVTNPNGKTDTYEYNLAGNPSKTVVDPSGQNLITSYTYEDNQFSNSKDPNTNSPNSTTGTQPTEQYIYDGNGRTSPKQQIL